MANDNDDDDGGEEDEGARFHPTLIFTTKRPGVYGSASGLRGKTDGGD